MATVTVKAWVSLSHLFGGEATRQRSVEVEIPDGTTLLAVLRLLAERYPSFGSVMFEAETDEPSDQVTVVVNDQLPEVLEGYETRLHSGDRIILVQAYAGG